MGVKTAKIKEPFCEKCLTKTHGKQLIRKPRLQIPGHCMKEYHMLMEASKMAVKDAVNCDPITQHCIVCI